MKTGREESKIAKPRFFSQWEDWAVSPSHTKFSNELLLAKNFNKGQHNHEELDKHIEEDPRAQQGESQNKNSKQLKYFEKNA